MGVPGGALNFEPINNQLGQELTAYLYTIAKYVNRTFRKCIHLKSVHMVQGMVRGVEGCDPKS